MPRFKIFDFISKANLLDDAFSKTGDVHSDTKHMFQQAFEGLYEEYDTMAKKLVEEDKTLNGKLTTLRKELIEYLSLSSTPNINATFVLVNIIVDYERIGDYCKNIVQIRQLFPVKLDNDNYLPIIEEMKDIVMKMFDTVSDAFTESDKVKAEKARNMSEKVKEVHARVVEKLNDDLDITPRAAIVYSSLANYLRRVGGHLNNIASSVLHPFYGLGFSRDYLHHGKEREW